MRRPAGAGRGGDYARAMDPGSSAPAVARSIGLVLGLGVVLVLDRRRLDPGHLTGSDLVVDPASRRVLLLLAVLVVAVLLLSAAPSLLLAGPL